MPPQTIVSALAIGWPPELVQSVNGNPNALISGDRASEPDPRFLRIAELMQELIVVGVIDLALERTEDGDSPTPKFTIHGPPLDPLVKLLPCQIWRASSMVTRNEGAISALHDASGVHKRRVPERRYGGHREITSPRR